jgi:hypothetical protein
MTNTIESEKGKPGLAKEMEHFLKDRPEVPDTNRENLMGLCEDIAQILSEMDAIGDWVLPIPQGARDILGENVRSEFLRVLNSVDGKEASELIERTKGKGVVYVYQVNRDSGFRMDLAKGIEKMRESGRELRNPESNEATLSQIESFRKAKSDQKTIIERMGKERLQEIVVHLDMIQGLLEELVAEVNKRGDPNRIVDLLVKRMKEQIILYTNSIAGQYEKNITPSVFGDEIEDPLDDFREWYEKLEFILGVFNYYLAALKTAKEEKTLLL